MDSPSAATGRSRPVANEKTSTLVSRLESVDESDQRSRAPTDTEAGSWRRAPDGIDPCGESVVVEIPDQLECLFSASVDQQGDSYRIEIPRSELDEGTITSGETYRVALVSGTPRSDSVSSPDSDTDSSTQQSSPVEPGDVREVTIESLGDQGDGIAKIDRGYVVIVPETRPDDEVTIEIEQTRENVAFARVRDNHGADESSEFDDPLAEETLGEGE
jgi:predicted RNA-binding protein with TRAM domain